ncbi:hypothetical protein [Methylocystis sp.]|uniref:hypothetical protein n=1 Tax=Methylocystis sp. TaxID=1911079 RepID=UPI0025E99E4B|nr:hypothetical protein [Methylocystis sp.]
MEQIFEYDVAFSFLAKDENITFQLNDALKGSLKTFLYSEQQKRLAGTDGEATFASVFGQKSCSMVILYREDWGTTPWTRIEETSIRNRAYESGYDFALLMPLDKPPTKPKWFPQNRLWIGFERWGIKGAAAVIEARVQELGGTLHRETLEERAARHERETEFKREREAALNSYEGVAAFENAIEKTRIGIRDGIERINRGRKLNRLAFRGMPQPNGPCAVTGLRYALTMQGRALYSNTLEGASSDATIWKNGFPWPGALNFDEPQKYRTLKFDLDYLPTQAYAWQTLDQDGAFSPEELADEILKWYLDNGGDPA